MKQIPIRLQEHYNGYATTWCYIMRIACVGRFSGVIRGCTSLDEDVIYDDGQGVLTYSSSNAAAPAKFQQSSDFSVDNTEITGWVTDDEITMADIMAGIFDFAEVTIYRVNYMDLSQGHEVVAFGTLGQTQFTEDRWRCEFRSLTQQSKQPYGKVYSLTCRNQYGDDKCKMPFEWFTGTIDALGDDPTLVFQATELTQAAGYFAPGVVEILSGANAGADMDVDEFFSGGIVRLALQMPMPFQIGDQFRIRGDCNKEFATCKAKGNVLEFRGEHLTPVADTGLGVPGAYVSRQGS